MPLQEPTSTLDEILSKDVSEEFLCLLQIEAGDDFKPKFVEHMVNAMLMSHFKYGWVKDKPSSHYKMLSGFEEKAYHKDGNDEHLVNIANYAMMQYMTDDTRPDYISIAADAMRSFNESRYEGTDSDKSVQHKRVKPSPVRSQLRKLIEDGPYDFFTPAEDLNYTIFD